MRLNLSGHHVDVTPALRSYTERKDEVIHGENGFFYQMNSSLGADATWYEGAWSYHFYALSALLRTAEAAYRSGINLYKEPKLKKMLEIPLRCLMPNGRLPALNDSEEMAPPLSLYEVASARYGDRFFQNVIAGSQRGGLDAFLIGIPKPLKQKTVLTSMILLDSGIAILRKRDQYIALDFGPHGGYHGHYDKLALNFFTAGQVYAPDPGRGWPYNLPIHREWYKRTLAHNTVLVDRARRKTAPGLDLQRIAALSSPRAVTRELSKPEARLEAATAGTSPEREVSKAKPPVRPVTGSPHTADQELDDDAPLSAFVQRFGQRELKQLQAVRQGRAQRPSGRTWQTRSLLLRG